MTSRAPRPSPGGGSGEKGVADAGPVADLDEAVLDAAAPVRLALRPQPSPPRCSTCTSGVIGCSGDGSEATPSSESGCTLCEEGLVRGGGSRRRWNRQYARRRAASTSVRTHSASTNETTAGSTRYASMCRLSRRGAMGWQAGPQPPKSQRS
jgi:hypothetical protein